jgi:predicted secreted protein
MTIRTRVGDTFVVELEGNPTTGYVWEPEAHDSVEFVGREVVQSGGGIGAGARERLSFRSRAAGAFTLKVRHKRPWEPAALETRAVKVSVSSGD